MTDKKLVVDCATGQKTLVDLTDEEIEFRASLDVAAPPTVEDRVAIIEQVLEITPPEETR